MNAKQLHKMFPLFSVEYCEFLKDKNELKTERGFLARMQKKHDERKKVISAPDVTRIEITLEWRRNSTWGLCPRAAACVYFANGESVRKEYASITGSGYDKASTAISIVFNDFCKGMAYKRLRYSRKPKPYGISESFGFPYFGYGVGVNCYLFGIADYLGLKAENVCGTKYTERYVFSKK